MVQYPKFGEERSIICDCTHEEKTFEVFTQNGCYGNQPTLPALLQNKISLFKQAYLVSFSFILCDKLKRLWIAETRHHLNLSRMNLVDSSQSIQDQQFQFNGQLDKHGPMASPWVIHSSHCLLMTSGGPLKNLSSWRKNDFILREMRWRHVYRNYYTWHNICSYFSSSSQQLPLISEVHHGNKK